MARMRLGSYEYIGITAEAPQQPLPPQTGAEFAQRAYEKPKNFEPPGNGVKQVQPSAMPMSENQVNMIVIAGIALLYIYMSR